MGWVRRQINTNFSYVLTPSSFYKQFHHKQF